MGISAFKAAKVSAAGRTYTGDEEGHFLHIRRGLRVASD